MKQNSFKKYLSIFLSFSLIFSSSFFAFPQKSDAVVKSQKRIFITSGSTWTVPSDWNNASNTIEVIGGGAGGQSSSKVGGGGGAYAKITNLTLTPSASVNIGVGTGGGAGSNGGDTWFNATSLANAVSNGSSVSVAAQGAQGATGGLASASVGTTKNNGGSGGSDTGGRGGTGGGGAAGPNGAGASGGSNGVASNPDSGGSGGGGSDGGSNGGNVNSNDGTNGGNNFGGTGGGAGRGAFSNTPGGAGTNGGGGGGTGYAYGADYNAGNGGAGTEWDGSHGSGGGGGGQAYLSGGNGGNGGGYGGGGGGAQTGGGGTTSVGGSGAQGIIVVAYTPAGTTKVVLSKTLSLPGNNLGLVGWWTFDGKDTPWTSSSAATTLDKSGNGNTGTLTNMVQSTAPVPGKIGQALNFNGTNSYVTTANIADNLGTMSVAFWFNTTQSQAGAPKRTVLISKMTNSNNGAGWQIRQRESDEADPNGLDVLYQDSGGNNWIQKKVTTAFNDGKWHHFVWTVTGGPGSGATFTVYVDGVSRSLDDGSNGTFSSISTTQNVIFGKDGDSDSTSFYNGKLDDVRIYNRALSATEVANLYNSSQSKYNVSLVGGSGLSNGLVGYWTFDGKDTPWTSSSAATTLDKSGSGNTGTLTNMLQSTAPVPGKIGQALKFDGSSSYINVPYSTNIDFEYTDSFTISAWVKRDSNNNSTPAVVGRFSGSRGIALAIQDFVWVTGANANSISLWMYDSSAVGHVVFYQSPTNSFNSNNVWQHVTISYGGNSSSVNIYINGVSQTVTSVGTLTTGTIKNGLALRIGDDYTGDWMNGTLDDVRIYNRALSAGEVTQLYNLGR